MEFAHKARLINKQFGLNDFVGQDWSLICADAKKLDAFTDFYLETNDPQEKSMVFDLIINSLQEVTEFIEVKKYWQKIESKVAKHFDLHHFYLIFYTQIGEAKDEDGFLLYTEFFSDWLCETIKESSISIKSNKVEEIFIDDISLNEWLKGTSIELNFKSIVDYLKEKEPTENNTLSFRDEDSTTIRDYVHIKKGIYKEFTFLQLSTLRGSFNYLKLSSNKLEAELARF